MIGAHHRVPSGPHAKLQSTLAVAEEVAVLLGRHLGCQDPSWARFLTEERFSAARESLELSDAQFEVILECAATQLSHPKRVA